MGGMVTVGFRFRDGTTTAQIRSTNPLPVWMNDPRMFEGDPNFVTDYISKAEDKSPVSLVPRDYGLVVVDFKENRLLSMQNLCSFGRIQPARLMNDLRNGSSEDYDRLLKAGRLSESLQGWSDINGRQLIERNTIQANDMSELMAIGIKLENKTYNLRLKNKTYGLCWEFGVDTSPLVVESFGDGSPRHTPRLMARMQELGFNLEADKAAWQEFMEGDEVAA